MKKYFRNEKGDFCSAKEWFGMGFRSLKPLMLAYDVQEAECRLAKMRKEHPRRLADIETAILGAVTVLARQHQHLEITADTKGCVVIWWPQYAGEVNNRHTAIREIVEMFAKREKEQATIVDIATAAYVETE